MKEVIQSAEDLRDKIKQQEDEIDNPALVISVLSQLDNFIENIKEVH